MNGVLLDTSVIVQALVEQLPGHQRAFETLVNAKKSGLNVAAHAVAESYATLSTLPVSPRLAPSQAWHLLDESILSAAKIVSLSSRQYVSLMRRLAAIGLSGGTVYDALHAAAAEKSNAERLYTFNRRDFQRMEPHFALEFVYL